jgi:hypothetical protein
MAKIAAPAKKQRKPPPSAAQQQSFVDRSQAISASKQSLFARFYRESVDLSNARLSAVYGVLIGTAFFYINGIASQWAPILSQPQMYSVAGIFGAATGVILARSLSSIRRLENEEGDRAKAKEDTLGVVERIKIVQQVLPQLPAPEQKLLLNAAIFSSLEARLSENNPLQTAAKAKVVPSTAAAENSELQSDIQEKGKVT